MKTKTRIKEIGAAQREKLYMKDLKPCQMAKIITPGSRFGEIIIRSCSISNFEAMSLSDFVPGNCWSPAEDRDLNLEIELLPHGFTVELVNVDERG